MQPTTEEFRYAVDTLRKLCFQRADTKRLGALIKVLILSFEDLAKAASDLLDCADSFERVVKSERMEILYPFENVKIASHEFGSKFLEGYFDWNEVSYDPYRQLALAEKMLDGIEVAKDYIQNTKSPAGVEGFASMKMHPLSVLLQNSRHRDSVSTKWRRTWRSPW